MRKISFPFLAGWRETTTARCGPQHGWATITVSSLQVVAARAATMRWMGKMDAERALQEGGKDNAGTGELVDADTDMFEKQLTQVTLSRQCARTDRRT